MSLDFSALNTNELRVAFNGTLLPTRVEIFMPRSPCGYMNFNEASGAALRSLLRLRNKYGAMDIHGFRLRLDKAQLQFRERTAAALEARQARASRVSGMFPGARVVHLAQPFGPDELEERLVALEQFTLAAEKAGATRIAWT